MRAPIHRIHHTTQLGTRFAMFAYGLALALAARLEHRWARVRASGNRGSESVEKAVLVAIMLAVVIGLAVAIRAVVQKYQGKLQ